MWLMQQLPRSQRVGIFCGVFVALLALLVHNPFDGYVTAVTWMVSPGPQCPHPTVGEVMGMSQADMERNMALTKQFCGGYESRGLPFSQWTSAQPLVGWLGNLMHILAIEAAVTVLTVLWVALF